MIHIYQS